MNWRNRSLRRRLVVWLLTPLFVIFAAMLAESYSSVSRSADKAYDRSLLGSALAIAERVVAIDGQLEVDLPYVALEMLTSTAQNRVFYKVTGPNDGFITGYRDLPSPPSGLAMDDQPLIYDARSSTPPSLKSTCGSSAQPSSAKASMAALMSMHTTCPVGPTRIAMS